MPQRSRPTHLDGLDEGILRGQGIGRAPHGQRQTGVPHQRHGSATAEADRRVALQPHGSPAHACGAAIGAQAPSHTPLAPLSHPRKPAALKALSSHREDGHAAEEPDQKEGPHDYKEQGRQKVY
eukprot:157998-Chlamydomonas_euryale.AAC.3